jgi:hypothetical protein
MSDAANARDPLSRALQAHAEAQPPDAAPYDFAEFQRRVAFAPVRSTRPAHGLVASGARLRIAAVLAPLALLAVIAGLGRRDGPAPPAARVLPLVQPAAEVESEPALVRVGQAVARGEIEDHIAWVDAMLSDVPPASLSLQDRAVLLAGREQLTQSLQRVRHAESLLAY